MLLKNGVGPKAEFEKKKEKREGAIRYLLRRHRERDNGGYLAGRAGRKAALGRWKIKRWLDENDDKPGKGGKPKKSNITDRKREDEERSRGHPRL